MRTVPAALLTHLQSTAHTVAYCWAIVPRVGDPEGYCNLPGGLDLPAYTYAGGDTDLTELPAMTYTGSSGVSLSAIPTRLQNAGGADGTDAGLLVFDRDKLAAGYYEGAEFELFIVNYEGDLTERLVLNSGKIDNIRLQVTQATAQLTPWPSIASKPGGRVLTVLCDVGRVAEMRGEEFGAGRCRNAVLNDGPLKADWTVLATVESVANSGQFTVSFGGTAISSATLHAQFAAHLAEGRAEFVTGDLTGAIRDVKSAANSGGDYVLAMHRAFPSAPAIGDTLHLTAGCRRTRADCAFYNNTANFRGQHLLPGQEGAARRITT